MQKGQNTRGPKNSDEEGGGALKVGQKFRTIFFGEWRRTFAGKKREKLVWRGKGENGAESRRAGLRGAEQDGTSTKFFNEIGKGWKRRDVKT